jgi:arsenate reductase
VHKDKGMADDRRVYNVLFLCTGNSARSILGEVILNLLGEGRFKAYSAGSEPAGKVNPYAIALLEHLDYPTDGLRSKSWDEFSGPDAPQMDFVFTVCDNAAKETCPVWPGHPMTAHWGIPDPAAVEGSDAEKAVAFSDAYRMLASRINLFLNLPIESLDKMSLRRQLVQIGQSLSESA